MVNLTQDHIDAHHKMWSNMQGKGAMMYSTDIISSILHAMLLGLLLCAHVGKGGVASSAQGFLFEGLPPIHTIFLK